VGTSPAHHFQRIIRGYGLGENLIGFEPKTSGPLEKNMAKEITLAELQTLAKRSGLQLTDEELEKLLPGVNRSDHQLLELRELITDSIEPAAAFVASPAEKR
jgi:hypothetical protein